MKFNKLKTYIFNLLFKDYIDNKFIELEKHLLDYKREYNQAILDCDNAVIKCNNIKNNISNILNHFDISLDYSPHKYARNWCVISLQGKNQDYVRFIDDISNKDIRDISSFLNRFKNYKIDCPIGMKEVFKIERNKL